MLSERGEVIMAGCDVLHAALSVTSVEWRCMAFRAFHGKISCFGMKTDDFSTKIIQNREF